MGGTPSRALRVDNFVRPFTEAGAKALFAAHGDVVSFWMPPLKTHAYAVYGSPANAASAAAALAGAEWPAGAHNALRPRFVRVEEAEAAAAAGEAAPPPPPASVVPPPAAPVAPAPPAAPAVDDLFKRTEAAPPLYWAPAPGAPPPPGPPGL